MAIPNRLLINPSADGNAYSRFPLGDFVPSTITSANMLVLGNSLEDHGANDSPRNFDFTGFTQASAWVNLFVQANGLTFSRDGRFGFYDQFIALDWTETGDLVGQGYTHCISMPSNFLGEDMGAIPYDNPVTTSAGKFGQVYDLFKGAYPSGDMFLYAHRPDGGQYTSGITMTAQQQADFRADTQGDYLDWFIDCQNAIVASGRSIRMMPVAAVTTWLLDNITALQSITFEQLYADNAPHGSENIYFLDALTYFRQLFGVSLDTSSFTFPVGATQIRSEIINNLPEIVAAIPGRLDFHSANGVLV